MLPGIRFLCAAVVLTVSLVIFGMGAAALLRSAHQEFANLPNRRPAPTTVFSRQPETAPALAMLRLDLRADVQAAVPAPAAAAPSPADVSVKEEAPTPALPAPIEPARVVAVAAESQVKPEPTADTGPVLSAVAPPPREVDSVRAPVPALPQPTDAAVEPSVAIATAPIATPEPASVAPEATPAAAAAATPAAPETTASISLPTASILDLPNATLTEEDAQLSSSKVAVLGGPPIDTKPVPLPNVRPAAERPKAKPAKKVVKKPAVKRTRAAARVLPASPAPAPAAQQNDPFGLTQLR
jgi:hypothetical protein